MKKSAILWSVLLVVFCALAIRHGLAFAAIPFPFKPNWLTIILAIATWAAFIGMIIRKELTAAESRVRKARAELVEVDSKSLIPEGMFTGFSPRSSKANGTQDFLKMKRRLSPQPQRSAAAPEFRP